MAFTVNELLCFVKSQYDKLHRQNLNSVILEFYTREETVLAKNVLISHCEQIGLSNAIAEPRKNRIGVNVDQKVVKDILDLWEIIDTQKGGQLGTEFVASDPNRLPSVNADKFNLQYLTTCILKLQEQNALQQAQLEIITKSFTAVHNKLSNRVDPYPQSETSVNLPQSPRSLPIPAIAH